jgi:2-amino-4-hydroxy-6-hydroxymethyldihydropteridine diphosphokinase
MLKISAIALGSNATSSAGTPVQTVISALIGLSDGPLTLTGISRFWLTPAFPPGSGPEFVNAAATITSKLSASEVLTVLHGIEDRFGRKRTERWGPRTLDLDLLFHGDEIMPDRAAYDRWATLPADRQRSESPDRLVLPHPRLQDRGFVLLPLAEVAPGWRHPVTGLTVAEMAAAIPAFERQGMRPV